ncbi:hypothetical protein RUND412_003746 [Rhizina undulata]
MSDWFGGLNIGMKYAIVLACLIAATFIAGFAKLFYIRQQTKKLQAELKLKVADEEGKVEQIALNQREEDEGDLFGIRALERGFYAGVAQSRPTTPSLGATFSTSTLVPSGHIPYGQPTSPFTASGASTPTLEVSGDNSPPKTPSPVALPSGRLSPQHGRIQDVAIDMQLNVPDSPRLPRSEESSRAPSPLSIRSSPRLNPVTIPSPGLNLNYSESSGFSRQQAKAPMPVTTNAAREETMISESASIVSEEYSVYHPESRSHTPTPPPRTYKTYSPSIRIQEPSSPSPNESHQQSLSVTPTASQI